MKIISNRKPTVKVVRSFMINREVGDELKEINSDTDFSLVRDKKGQLFTRIRQPQLKKDGKWINLRFSTWGSTKMQKIGWDYLPKNQKRESYKVTPVTRAQAIRWLINENIPNEFKADFMKMLSA